MNAGRLWASIVTLGAVAVGCYVVPVDPALTPPPTGYQASAYQGTPPPQQGGPPMGGPIEAGCSFNATSVPAGPGQTVQVACPPGCESTGGVWGTDVYTGDSAICRAAIHAGLISPSGGVVALQIEGGRPAYRGSMRFGIQSADYGNYGSSYVFVRPMGQPAAMPPPPPAPPQVIEAGCSFNATQIKDAVGTSHLVSCPPGCENQGGLWGTDVYTGDSGICRAAIHAGLISPGGGSVVVILDVGRPAYRGTVRYGIHSSDYGNYASSFRLQRP